MDSKHLPLRPVETQRASEAIYEQIKELIVSGQLKPGDRLPSERNMMGILQRSRPTIREALRMLERAGFIRTVHGTTGAIIQEYSTCNVEQPLKALLQVNSLTVGELAEYRMQSESAMARWAAGRRTEEDIATLEALQDEMSALISACAYDEVAKLDPRFHGMLAKAAKNEVSYIMTRVYGDIVRDIMMTSMQQKPEQEQRAICERARGQHQKIIDAVCSGNEADAEAAMQLHLKTFRTLLE